ncbi:undecaprenyl-phosphate 4-deoxy-4-formamido-L-arabinose transferase [Streptosporangium album]|uniref:Undecaprenyl-phosphate 4-deoxy-4-formamido-L-arabinose transferase n=1 Tax=Streptosporangium album TaxID=47479 RepID=A0A7W7RPE3_9ACTN|nr:undecaprenyl-phosphate 4-deoxy-4-formamido-L-arabinose transferase [Streptosporangium album]
MFEVVLVVDGSPDNTWEVAQELADRHETVRALLLARNYGQHNALVAGIRSARYDIVVTMDDDLQHPPEEIPKLLAGLRPDLDIVYAVPCAGTHGFIRDLASKSLKIGLSGRFGEVTGQDICAFRAFRSFLRESLDGVAGPHALIDISFSWATMRVGTVRVNMERRPVGGSNYTLPMLIHHAIHVMVGYSTIPLRLVTYFGLLTGSFGAALLAIFLWNYWWGDSTLKGFTSIASMISLFASAQMVALGIIGEYLGRIHVERMGRPTYIVRERSESQTPRLSTVPDVSTETLIRPGADIHER